VLLFLRHHAEAGVTDATTALLVRVPTLSAVVNDLVWQADLLDINTANKFKALPGICDAYSEKIIKGRPYVRRDELEQTKILRPPMKKGTGLEEAISWVTWLMRAVG
jgi:DNA uptake protein ComE-like DNA-binding protein